MIVVDFVAAIIAPIIIPLYDFLLAQVNVSKIIGKNKKSARVQEEHLHEFIKGLPSAFIGNAIWGFTYGIHDIIWVTVYFIIVLLSIGLLMLSNWKKHLAITQWIIIIFGIMLVLLTVFRIFCFNRS